ncbi:MAG TPA: CAP domain-containing protein [Labilithrix sp.]|nr:CAP domain-containing protein [Labilithrix sp.]
MISSVSRSIIVLLLPAVFACGGATANAAGEGRPGDGDQVEERVVLEKQSDGSIKKTTIRTTKRVVPAPAPPARPADPYPSDPLVRYNVERVNAYRAQKGLPALLYDANISAFARRGSEQLARDHAPHAHFAANVKGAPGFGSRSAENQGDPGGVPSLDADASRNGKKQVDIMLKLMMDEGPGGGHYDNMMNTRFRRIGIGLFYAGGKLYMTNDFSD